MSILFETVRIKDMELRNRFVRSATYDGSAEENGRVSERQMKLFTDLAAGGVGLIVTGIAHVHPSGQARARQLDICRDDGIESFKRLTQAVHRQEGKIAVQLFHGGREAADFLNQTGKKALAPAVVPNDPYFKGDYREITEDEIEEIVRSFGDAARRAREGGFDAVQVHGAHAFLLSQFLSPYTNHREDRWGGSLENRLRLHLEIYAQIRKSVGDDYPVLIKIGVQDGFAGGLHFEEGKAAARMLAQAGFNALEISQGLRGNGFEEAEFRTGIDSPEQEAYFRRWCSEISRCVDAPTMMMGGLRSFELMEEAVRAGEAAFVSLSRPFIRQPGLIDGWMRGDRRRASCISCNKCLGIVRRGDGLKCAVEEEKKNMGVAS